jgi:asparagine synthase (glutamine-hydrolysing)
VLGPLADQVAELLGPRSLAARGLFRGELVSRLRSGQGGPGEGRRRRIGERLWALLMLEAWLRVFIDQRGRRPGAAP